MAAGDAFIKGVTATAQNAYLNLQPDSGTECIIHNISHSTDATLEFYDGTTAVTVDVKTGAGSWMGMYLHCTNTKYYRVKNTNVASNNLCCDGVQTK
jgi:uncharacterized protein (DUF2147 family)